MKAYSEDLRQRVIRPWQMGKPLKELISIFGVSAGSVRRWLRQYQTTGQLVAKPRQDWKRKIGSREAAALREQVGQMSDATLASHVAAWEQAQGVQVSASTMWRALQAIGWSLKKRQWVQPSATKRRGKPSAN